MYLVFKGDSWLSIEIRRFKEDFFAVHTSFKYGKEEDSANTIEDTMRESAANI